MCNGRDEGVNELELAELGKRRPVWSLVPEWIWSRWRRGGICTCNQVSTHCTHQLYTVCACQRKINFSSLNAKWRLWKSSTGQLLKEHKFKKLHRAFESVVKSSFTRTSTRVSWRAFRRVTDGFVMGRVPWRVLPWCVLHVCKHCADIKSEQHRPTR